MDARERATTQNTRQIGFALVHDTPQSPAQVPGGRIPLRRAPTWEGDKVAPCAQHTASGQLETVHSGRPTSLLDFGSMDAGFFLSLILNACQPSGASAGGAASVIADIRRISVHSERRDASDKTLP